MSYLHVSVKFRDAPEKVRCIFSDLSEKELEANFLKPYRLGRATLSGAEVIDVNSIVSTQIIETQRVSELELKEIQDISWKEIQEYNRHSDSVVVVSPGHGYNSEDIAEAGSDVTSRYITSPPGHQTSSIVSSALNHQWVVAIIGGLVVAGVAAWLGWG